MHSNSNTHDVPPSSKRLLSAHPMPSLSSVYHEKTLAPIETCTRRSAMRRNSCELPRPAPCQAKISYPKSAPPSPKSKSVRFNDDRLELVQYFTESDTPQSIRLPTGGCYLLDSPRSYIDNGLTINMPNFPCESVQRQAQPVRLEFLRPSENGTSLLGLVSVANLNYHKQVRCRFTWDNWHTVSFVEARYDQSAFFEGTPSGYDSFIFHIDLSFLSHFHSRTLHCCIQYVVNECEFWDNNNASNFGITLSKASNDTKFKESMSPVVVLNKARVPLTPSDPGLSTPKSSLPLDSRDLTTVKVNSQPKDPATTVKKARQCLIPQTDAHNVAQPLRMLPYRRYDLGKSLADTVRSNKRMIRSGFISQVPGNSNSYQTIMV